MILPPPFTEFHFLRPEWLAAILPGLLLAALAWRRIGVGQSPWRGLVDAHLLQHLALQEPARGRRWPIAALLLGWVLAALAMAGPAWQKLPTPALDRLDPTVVVLSLGQSMNATDQNPTRLLAARHKVDDILARMRGGQVGLVIYADAPFVAAPLTEDGRVVAQMLPELATDLMPVMDDRPDLAIRSATDLLRNAGARTGRIVLIGDGLGDRPAQTLDAASAAAKAGFTVNAIGVGTPEGSPLVAYDGGVIRARDGAVRTTRLEADQLADLARRGGGRFTRIAADDHDLDAIFAKSPGTLANSPLQNSGLVADQWIDQGPFLVLVVTLLAALAFRRGWLAAMLLAVGLSGTLAPREAAAQSDGFAPPPGMAAAAPAAAPAIGGDQWDNLWHTPNQQGARAFESGAYDAAAERFQDPAWQASAKYKAGDFETAAAQYAQQPGADYNRGNALARAGKLEDALNAYDAAIAANPNDDDAVFNRDLVQRLLDAQKKQDQDKDKDKSGQDKGDQKGGGQDKPGQDKPGDDTSGKVKNGQEKPGQDKPGDDKAGQDKTGKVPPPQGGDKGQPQPDPKGTPSDKGQPQPKPEPPKAPAKPEPGKSDPAKPDPAKPEPGKPDPAKSEPPKPAPAPGGNGAPPQPPPQPPPAPPQQAGPPQPPHDQPPQAAIAAPLSAEQKQNSEQALRMVPDDPTGLLRARIRSHYVGGPVPVPGAD